MIKDSMIHKISKIAIDVTIIAGLVAVFCVPMFVKYWSNIMEYNNKIIIQLNIILITSGIVAILILFQLRKIMKSIVNNNPFTEETVSSLRKISIFLLIIAIIYLIKLFFGFSLGTLVIVLTFGMATLIFLTIKDVFKQAVVFKEENEWTI